MNMSDVSVSSNWSVADEKNLTKVITYCSSESNECDIDNLTIDSCVCLIQNDHNEPEPELDLQSKNLLQKIDIYSEGSLIEVFGIYHEYLFTCECDFIDDWEGVAVYHAKVNLPNISSCKLKFKRTKEKRRLWIYNIHLGFAQCEKLFNQALFNFENVNKLMNGSSQQISEKAEKFKKFFEAYLNHTCQFKSFSSQSCNFPVLLNEFSKDYMVTPHQCAKNLDQSLSEIRISDQAHIENTTTSGENIIVNKNPLADSCLLKPDGVEFLKKYFDDKLYEMKEDILKCIERKFNDVKEENNLKFEKIISLLENSKL